MLREPGPHHRADDRGPAPAAGGVRLRRLYPRQGHPGCRSPPHPAAGPAGRPAQRQHRAAQRQKPAPCWPRTRAGPAILAPMAQIRDGIAQSRQELAKYRHAPRFAPAGQSTQMIIGATPESDRHILMLTQGLYDKYQLKRVFYSAYMPVSASSLLPAPQGFQAAPAAGAPAVSGGLAAALLPLPGRGAAGRGPARLRPPCWTPSAPGPCATWTSFPVEVNRADYEALLRVPGIGVHQRQAHPHRPAGRTPVPSPA